MTYDPEIPAGYQDADLEMAQAHSDANEIAALAAGYSPRFDATSSEQMTWLLVEAQRAYVSEAGAVIALIRIMADDYNLLLDLNNSDHSQAIFEALDQAKAEYEKEMENWG